jgi:hypothetical protein
MAPDTPSLEVVERLAMLFARNGYIRRPDLKRRAAAASAYKKGYEVRLVADSVAELRAIRRLLRASGFHPGRPFAKSRQWRQPLYGRQAVTRFLGLIGSKLEV